MGEGFEAHWSSFRRDSKLHLFLSADFLAALPASAGASEQIKGLLRRGLSSFGTLSSFAQGEKKTKSNSTFHTNVQCVPLGAERRG